ncbi:MAG: hypothetical protein NXI16_01445 [Alphaproteobacteria bacterium]|nr:hypothetical protein [Alphaproteobacteria bacterium]
MSTYFVCDAAKMAMLHRFTSKEATRYYLQGVNLRFREDNTGAFLCATDGHRLGIFNDPTAIASPGWRNDTPAQLEPRAIKAALAAKKPSNGTMFVVVNDGDVHLMLADNAIEAHNAVRDGNLSMALERMCGRVIDGSFPAWERVVPMDWTDWKPHNPGFNASCVGDFAFTEDCKKPKKDGGGHAIRMFAKSNGHPMVIRNDHPDFLGVLMPMRWGSDEGMAAEKPIPDWLIDRPKATAKAA